MIYFLYGENNFAIKKAYNKLLGKIPNSVEKSVFNFQENIEFSDFYQQMQNNSLFSTKKIITLIDLIDGADVSFKEKFLEIRSNISSSDNIFVFIEYKIPRKNGKLYIWLIKNSKSQEYKLLPPAKIRSWAEDKFKEKEATVEEAALQYILNNCGKDMWLLDNEINKLCAYSKNITLVNAKQMIAPATGVNIFDAIDSLLRGDKKRTISLFRKSLKGGQSPQAVLALAATQIRNLLAIKQGDYSEMKLHPFVVQKLTVAVQSFELDDLKYIYKNMLQFDFETKTGKLDSEVSLELLANLF